MNKLQPDPFAELIWNNKAIPWCKHFLWLGHHDRLPTSALLHRRCIIDMPFCAYCGDLEDQEHLFLRCPRARRVWRAIGCPVVPFLPSFRHLWEVPELIEGNSARISSAIITALLWSIWKTRNALIFEASYTPTDQTVKEAAACMGLWSTARKGMMPHPCFGGVIDFSLLSTTH
ncbi:hypothetical protein BAE44_0022847 [Dichanthelium oligosanthes]|uniref:Reverse transcriptase zinc-binding domain-containing protein n=1 Tax=Dichanthelium oligosanthes TaxID=888268 RepID=A0A1E5UTI4_9POAL|nr:hypothetical protein BAE44_0022847 [Dichanthelium oligosanthes]